MNGLPAQPAALDRLFTAAHLAGRESPLDGGDLFVFVARVCGATIADSLELTREFAQSIAETPDL